MRRGARRRCPDLVFIKPCFEIYKAVSAEIHAVFAEHTDVVEPLSLDEAYLDVTVNEQGIASATAMCLGFVEDLPVGRFHGVEPATAAKMQGFGIQTGQDLRERALAFLQERFSKAGPFYNWIGRGIDERPVRANQERKSVGAENTFNEDLFTFEAMRDALRPIAEKVWRYCEAKGLHGRTVTLKVKYADFRQITRAQSSGRPVASRADLDRAAGELLAPLMPVPKGVRLLGLTVSSFVAETEAAERQLVLPM